MPDNRKTEPARRSAGGTSPAPDGRVLPSDPKPGGAAGPAQQQAAKAPAPPKPEPKIAAGGGSASGGAKN